jgi:protoporphyrinogen/coproporphyrinogen III oxidase
MARIVIVGAGIAGLSVAAFLRDRHDITILEASDHAGGNVRTDTIDGRTLDRAANGWLDSEPAIGRLVEQVGLTDQLIQADSSATRWIFSGGQLHPAPLSPPALLRSSLLSLTAKLRILLEPFIGRAPEGTEETIEQFVSRRLGMGVVNAMVGPMVSGIYAAGPEQLSLSAAFPRMHALEREHRSLILAALKLRRGGTPPGRLTSLAGGAGQLTAAIAQRLGDRLHCDTPVCAVERRREGWAVHTDGGSLTADAVVLAAPAPAQASLLRGVDGEVAETLNGIAYSPVAVVITAWPADAFPRKPDGFGVLMARGEPSEGVLGTLFTSSIFPQHGREGEVLMRSILGGAIYPTVPALDDQALLSATQTMLNRYLGSTRAMPTMVKIYRNPRGIPLYAPGHSARLATLRAASARHSGLFFAGNHMGGIGVKDCARAGELLAEQIDSSLR